MDGSTPVLAGLAFLAWAGAVGAAISTGRGGVLRLAQVCLLLAAAMLPWNAVQVSGVPLGDLPLGLALVLLVVWVVHENPRLHLPLPALWAAALIAVAGVLTEIVTVDPNYLLNRFSLSYPLQISLGEQIRSVNNLESLFKLELSVLVLPVAAALASLHDPRFPARLAGAWVAGITLSGLVACSDFVGLTHINAGLIGWDHVSGREGGLTSQPNNVGVQATMALPLALVGLRSPDRRVRIASGVAGLVAVLGVYVSGSRGAAVGLLVALAFALTFVPELRRWQGRAAALGVLAAAVLAASPAGRHVLATVRLVGAENDTERSDHGRAALRSQGLADFLHSPVNGIGWGHANEAHLIYVQLLAAGGVLGLAAFLLITLGTIRLAWAPADRHRALARALAAGTATWLVLGLVENQLVDQWLYLPVSVLGAVAVARRAERDREAPPTAGTAHPLGPPPVRAGRPAAGTGAAP